MEIQADSAVEVEGAERILRSLLGRRDASYAADLQQNFRLTEHLFRDTYAPLFPPDKGSLTGLRHSENVEQSLDQCLASQPTIRLSTAEAYVLLCATYLHDIAKAVSSPTKPVNELPSWFQRSFPQKAGANGSHVVRSAHLILESPERFAIFDPPLADCVARVCTLHGHTHRATAETHGWLGNVYLDAYGTVRIGWLGALLSLADEMDTGSRRTVPRIADEQGDKGAVRGLISGCEVDLLGMSLLLHGTEALAPLFDEDEPDGRLSDLHKYVLDKEGVLRSWKKELKQMNLELHCCALVLHEHRATTRTRHAEQQARPTSFMLAVEPKITPMKVERILEAMFKLRLGVFGKTSFTWEVLASEAGMQSVAEVRRVLHRLDSIVALDREHSPKIHLPYDQDKEARRPLGKQVQFEDLDGEWSVTIGPGEIEPLPPSRIKAIIKWRFASIFSATEQRQRSQETVEPPATRSVDPEPSGGPPKEFRAPAPAEQADNATEVFLVTGNEALNYLLDEAMCHRSFGRGILLPDYDCTEQLAKRKTGVNVLISGPPGIGKTSLALQIISTFKTVSFRNRCLASLHPSSGAPPVACGEQCADSSIVPPGVVAYVSIEQPSSTIEALTAELDPLRQWKESLVMPCLFDPSGAAYTAEQAAGSLIRVNLQDQASSGHLARHDEIWPRPYQWVYRELTKGSAAGGERVLLFTKLSPPFDQQAHSEGGNEVFWQRFKQLCRLCEYAPWYAQGWPVPGGQPLPPPFLGFVLDNLNGFGQGHLSREQIHQLFRLVSWAGILGVFIHEDPSDGLSKADPLDPEAAFLADIVIRLSWAVGDYATKQIEVVKSRYQRHVLGTHPFKIRDRMLCIYPSVHTQLAREERRSPVSSAGERRKTGITIPVEDSPPTDLRISKDSFVLLTGQRHTHKLAISMLYVLSALEGGDTAMILNFGPDIVPARLIPADTIHLMNGSPLEGMNLTLAATTPSIPHPRVGPLDPEKYKREVFAHKLQNGGESRLYVLTFNSGYLMPNECSSMILDEIYNSDASRIVFFSTYHLATRFPLLAGDTKFLPYLARMVKLRGKSFLVVALMRHQDCDQITEQVACSLESAGDYVLIATRPDRKVTDKINLEVRRVVDRDYHGYTSVIEFRRRKI